MSLLEDWRSKAYSPTANKNELKRLWDTYFDKEKKIYQELLINPDVEVKGTVKQLSERYGVELMTMVGFLDGIQESLKVPNDIDNMTEDTEVSLGFDKVLLYKNMVDAKAPWLYELEEWDNIFTKEEQKQYFKEQKQSHTFKRTEKKIGRNDPCPCGSGKKYKYCHGR
ncbi:MAG: SEC-C domain-containing protein [Lachnospiraceae bacterium]|nr:SEC-C domain-containing protein [Lachnospiraceae bacterium]